VIRGQPETVIRQMAVTLGSFWGYGRGGSHPAADEAGPSSRLAPTPNRSRRSRRAGRIRTDPVMMYLRCSGSV
jgi:hypothetical protein